MEVEAGNIVHDGLGHDVNRERDVGNRSLERCERRLRQKQRTRGEWTRQQSRDHEPSLGDEETSSNEQVGVGNISEVRQPLVGVRFDADDCHGGIVLRSTGALHSVNSSRLSKRGQSACDGVKCGSRVTGCYCAWSRGSAVVTAPVCAPVFVETFA